MKLYNKYLGATKHKMKNNHFQLYAIIHTFQAHISLYIHVYFSFYQATERRISSIIVYKGKFDATFEVIISGYLRRRDVEKIAVHFSTARRNVNGELYVCCYCQDANKAYILMPILAENAVKRVTHVMRIRPSVRIFHCSLVFFPLLLFSTSSFEFYAIHIVSPAFGNSEMNIFGLALRLVLHFFAQFSL